MAQKIESRSRRILRHWVFWAFIFALAIIALTAYSYTINARTLRDEAIRTAETQSAKDAAVARCLTSRPQLMRISRHVSGVNDLAAILVVNSGKVLEATPSSDPQYAIRVANLRRLIRAQHKIAAVNAFPVPTVAQCRAMGK